MQIPTIRAMKIEEPDREFIYRAPRESISYWVHSHNPWIDRVQAADLAQPEDVQLECTEAMEWAMNHQQHMISGFAAKAGVELPSQSIVVDLSDREIQDAVDEIEGADLMDYLQNTLFFGMHSMSCSSVKGGPPGKIIPIRVWNLIAEEARKMGFRTVGIGAESDEPFEGWEGELMHGQPLNVLAVLLNCRENALLSVDTGLKFLSSAVQGNFFTISCALPGWLIRAPHSGGWSVCHNLDRKMVDLLYNEEAIQDTVRRAIAFMKAVKVQGRERY